MTDLIDFLTRYSDLITYGTAESLARELGYDPAEVLEAIPSA